MRRRDFIKAAGLTLFAPQLFANNSVVVPNWDRVLVLVELKGGNDGLNTVVPYSDPNYYRLRPNIAVSKNRVLQLSETMGLNPSLEGLMASWQEKDLAVILGVGYPEPNRSHFRSIEIWETGSDSDSYLQDGWISRLFQEIERPKDLVADSIIFGNGNLGPLTGEGLRNININKPERFLQGARNMHEIAKESQNDSLQHLLQVQNDILNAAEILEEKLVKIPGFQGVNFPGGQIGQQLQLTAKLMAARIPVSVIKVSHGGFDTHSNQKNQHERLLQQLGDGLGAFRAAMKQIGLWDNVTVMTYSEFGRRAAENGSSGTDHGTAAPHFVLGGKVKGGIYGAQPSLTNLIKGGDLQYHVDYRSLYNTIAKNWWNISGGAHESFPIINCL